ncbi:MAG: hypothetical protein AAB263_17100 [Planctomycetota bacterium]
MLADLLLVSSPIIGIIGTLFLGWGIMGGVLIMLVPLILSIVLDEIGSLYGLDRQNSWMVAIRRLRGKKPATPSQQHHSEPNH